MEQLLELSNLCNVASQIDAEIRALSVRNTAAVRALRRQYTRQLKRPTQYLSSIWPGFSLRNTTSGGWLTKSSVITRQLFRRLAKQNWKNSVVASIVGIL
jgi:hypothetical protein